MAFFLEHSRDSALLALAIREGHRAASSKDRPLGRTAVQKIMYFVDVAGVPMGYRFDIHHFGPFCSEILRDTEWLIVDEVVKDSADTPNEQSKYAPGKNIDDLLKMYEPDLKPHRETVARVADALAPLQTKDLELYATLDYVYREQRAQGGSGPWKPRVQTRFKEFKKSKFTDKAIEDAYDGMVNAGLAQP